MSMSKPTIEPSGADLGERRVGALDADVEGERGAGRDEAEGAEDGAERARHEEVSLIAFSGRQLAHAAGGVKAPKRGVQPP